MIFFRAGISFPSGFQLLLEHRFCFCFVNWLTQNRNSTFLYLNSLTFTSDWYGDLNLLNHQKVQIAQRQSSIGLRYPPRPRFLSPVHDST